MKSLALCTFLILSASNGFYCKKQTSVYLTRKFKTGNLDIELKSNKISLNIRKKDGFNVRNFLFTKNPEMPEEEPEIEQDCEVLTTCILLNNVTHGKIKTDPDSEIIKITRVVHNPNGEIIDCYKFDTTEWFSGPELRYQHWPIEHYYFDEEAYLPSHFNNMAIAERYWLSSMGIYIYVDEKDPLFIDQNNYRDGHLCLISKNKNPYKKRESITLNYEIGVFADSRKAHEYVVESHFGKPSGYPNETMITHPIWSTWARYKVNISDKIVKKFANEIIKYGFNNSQIEIDDNWETCYGSAVFDPIKFPNIKELLNYLKGLKFRVTLWIHPFINEACSEDYVYAKSHDFFVKNTRGDVHTSWWQGNNAAIIDFTNPKAVVWWIGRLKKLEDLGIDSFKFDAGEVSWLPQPSDLTGPLDLQPGIYTQSYAINLAKYFDNNIEVRIGWRTQNLPIFVRMIDKDSRWTWNNGLPTLITTLLQMNLNGYIFVLPDMIGGNGYGEVPSKDLYIRWLQATVFMPAMQYSFVPWDFDDEVIAICKNFTNLHAEISPKIIELMKKAISSGTPLNPPIWWIDPSNIDARKINDEYLLGEDILVAPVIEEGAKTRNVYLPTGKWKDANNEKVYTGPIWLEDYTAPLNILPYFYKV